jgi:MoxR-like ATPase
MGRVIVGQKHLIDRLLIALVTNGHVLLEGVPGLAKTLSLKTLAGGVSLASNVFNSRRTCCPPTSWAR